MAINPNIAMGYRGVELQNPLNALAQVSQIQGAQQANKLGQMQMAEYERARSEEEGLRNFLSGADLTATETRNALMAKYGKSGREFAKGLTELDKARTEEAARKAKLAIDKTSMYRDAVVNITNPADAIEFMKLQANDPDMMGTPITRMPLMKVLSSIPQDPVGFENWKKQTALGMTKFVELNKPSFQTINQDGQTQLLQTAGLGGAPTSIGTYADVPLPPAVEAQRLRIAGAGAARQVTNVNTQIPASEEAQKEFMKEARVTFNTLKSAPSVLTNMEEAKKLVPSAKGFMGPGGEPLLNAASFLNNRLGTSIDTKGIEDATVLRSRLFTGVIENLRKLDAQPTQAQQKILQDAIGNLGTDPTALPRVLDAFGNILREKVGSYNAEVTDAEARGVKFPYNPVIKLPGVKTPAADQIPGQGAAGGNTVSLPDGRTMSFPNAAAAAQFKKAAGL
jgi:hypothetical protein